MQIDDIVKEFCSYLEKENIAVTCHFSKSGESAYISLDYGMLPSIRVSTHLKYKSSSFKYSIISSIEESRKIVSKGEELIFVPSSKEGMKSIVSEVLLLKRQQLVKLGLSKFNSMTPRRNIKYTEKLLNRSESIVFEEMGKAPYNFYVSSKRKRHK